MVETKMSELEVKIPTSKASSYPIRIGAGYLSSLWPVIETQLPQTHKIVVTDENVVSAGHLKKLLGDRNIPSFVISPAGEESKNITTVISIIEAMEKASFGRDSVIVALGGGTVGDIAGFAAAIFKRGVSVMQIPTTTVSQADSSIGGKTGVDSTLSKNAFGAFWQPAAVYIDVETLQSLDERQFRAGLVESVKHALIADEEYFDFIENNLGAILERKPDVLEQIACFNCKIKAGIVEVDPREKNERRMLNYGHTVGHAAEQASGFELLHGEAVAIGIIAAGLIEIQLDLGDSARLERIRKIFKKLDVPVTLPKNLAKDALIETMKRDKKAVNKWPRFVLLDRIGHVHYQNGQCAIEVGRELVEKVINKL